MAARTTAGLTMTQPVGYIAWMFLFVMVAGGLCFLIRDQLEAIFLVNQYLNGVIVAVLMFGIVYAFDQVMILWPEIKWVNTFRRGDPSSPAAPRSLPPLLTPMAMMLSDSRGPVSLTPTATRTILDSVGSRLDEGRDINRYLIGLLVFLGLLGTFWGLMQTVMAVGTTINSLNPGTEGDAQKVFEELRKGLEAPLSGMGTAFASSLFGLGGSLVLGFLDLQVGQAQNQFFRELEEWLSTVTRISAGAGAEAAGAGSLGTLMERTADNLEALERTLALAEVKRGESSNGESKLQPQVDALADAIRAQSEALERLVAKLDAQAEKSAPEGDSQTVEMLVERLIQARNEGKSAEFAEIKSELRELQQAVGRLSGPREP